MYCAVLWIFQYRLREIFSITIKYRLTRERESTLDQIPMLLKIRSASSQNTPSDNPSFCFLFFFFFFAISDSFALSIAKLARISWLNLSQQTKERQTGVRINQSSTETDSVINSISRISTGRCAAGRNCQRNCNCKPTVIGSVVWCACRVTRRVYGSYRVEGPVIEIENLRARTGGVFGSRIRRVDT